MINGVLDPGPATADLAFQSSDAALKLVHGQMVDVLPDKLAYRIVGALREKIVGLHDRNVDPGRAHVNKPIVV